MNPPANCQPNFQLLEYQNIFETCKKDKYVDNNLLKHRSIKWLRERDEVAFTVINRNKKQVHCDNILLETNGLNDNCTIVENC